MSGGTFFKRLIILLVAVGLVGAVLYVWQFYRISTPKDPYTFQIAPGDTISDVARNLKEQGIIPFQTYYYISHFVYAREGKVEPGGYELTSNMTMKQTIRALEGVPAVDYITIPPNTSRKDMGKIIGKALGWKDLDIQFFGHTMNGMQWQKYHDDLEPLFLKRFSWTNKQLETFLSMSSMYDEPEFDFLSDDYEPGTYQIPVGASRAQAAGVIIDQFEKVHGDKEFDEVEKRLDTGAMDRIDKMIKTQMELLPDIEMLPPSDITLKTEKGRTYLLFTTAYWNKGRGPLEIIGDPKTKDVKGDVERKVFQRIYSLDGSYRERVAGTFLWHQEHLHYHFADFALYTLTAVESDNTYKEFTRAKSTFCLRDSEPVDLTTPGANKDASYKICGRERQGISQGWADAYYYTYVDQRFDVTDAPTGQYLLTLTANPADRFEEITKENDKGEALILLNVKDGFVKTIEERQYGE